MGANGLNGPACLEDALLAAVAYAAAIVTAMRIHTCKLLVCVDVACLQLFLRATT